MAARGDGALLFLLRCPLVVLIDQTDVECAKFLFLCFVAPIATEVVGTLTKFYEMNDRLVQVVASLGTLSPTNMSPTFVNYLPSLNK